LIRATLYTPWQNVDRSRPGFGLKGGVMETCVGLLTHGDAASLFLPGLKAAPKGIVGCIRPADQTANLSGFNLSPRLQADWRSARCNGAAIEGVATVGRTN